MLIVYHIWNTIPQEALQFHQSDYYSPYSSHNATTLSFYYLPISFNFIIISSERYSINKLIFNQNFNANFEKTKR